MDLLNERLSKIIEKIIEEYIETAEAVGSQTLVDKFDLEVSPATVRNEMARLEDRGFLEKPHFSAGRVPTPLAFRYYVKHLMEEEGLSVVEEVSIKQELWDKRHDPAEVIKQAVGNLAQKTTNLSFALVGDDSFYHTGASYILEHPEFYDINLTRSVLQLLDRNEHISSIFNQVPPEYDEGILLGPELGLEHITECGLAFCRIQPTRQKNGYLAVLGPVRLRYSKVLPHLRYLRELINRLGQNL